MDVTDFIFVRDTKDKFDNHYTIKKKLGEGTFGLVSQCQHNQTGLIRAVKSIRKERLNKYKKNSEKLQRDFEQFLTEVRLL